VATSFAIGGAEQTELRKSQEILERLRNFRRPYDSRRDNLYSQVIGYSNPRTFPDKKTPRSNISVPYPFANFDQVRAVIMEALFMTDPPFEVLPRGLKDSDSALAMQRVLELMVLQRGRLRQAMTEYIGGLAIYGFYPIYVGWDWDYDTVPDFAIQPLTNPDGSLQIDYATLQPRLGRVPVRRKVPRNRPLYKPIDIYDLLIDPDGTYVARTFDKTFPQMLREQEMAAEAGQRLYADDALAKIDRYLLNQPDRDSQLIHIAELWDAISNTATLVATPPDQEILSYKDHRFANRSASYSTWRRSICDIQPLLLTPRYENPYLHCKVPILYTNYTKLPGETFGTGVVEPVAEVVEHINNMIRAIEDNWNLGVNQRYALDRERVIDLEGLMLANVPGGLIFGDGDVDKWMKEIPTHTPSPGDYSILALYQQMIETGSGQSDFYSRGVGTPRGNETATGITSVIAQASKRLVGVVQQIEEDIIEPLLQMTASNIQQFITDEVEVRITDEMPVIPKTQSQFLTIAPADLAGSFDFRLMGSLYMENRMVQQTHALQLAEILAGSPYVKHPQAEWELMRLFRIPYPNRLLKTEEEVQQEQLMMLQQQLGLAQLQQQMGLIPDAREQGTNGKGGKAPRSYAKPASNPATTEVRQQGQQTGLNALGLEGLGLAR